MAEYFGKYQNAQMRDTNATLDDPVVFLAGYTKAEALVCLISVVASAYFISISLLVTLVLLPVGPFLMRLQRYIREELPPNFFMQLIWHFGWMNERLEKHQKRPRGTYLAG